MVSDHTAFCHFVARFTPLPMSLAASPTPSTMSRAASPTPRVTSLAASPASRAASRAVEPPSSGVRYPPGRGVVVLGGCGGVLRHGAGLGGDNRRGSRSHIRGFIAGTSGQRQSQSEPDAEQSPCAFHVCSSCSFQWISFRWIHPAPSIRYSTLITRGKKCQRKKGCNFQKDLLI